MKFDLEPESEAKRHVDGEKECECVVDGPNSFLPPDCVLFDFHHLLLNRYFKSPQFRTMHWGRR